MTVGHSLADLFTPEPAQWGLRGDPYLWRELRRRTESIELPAELPEIEYLLHDLFRTLVGVDLRDSAEPEHVYRSEFAHGGMSSGLIHLDTWRHRFMPLLLARARALLDFSWSPEHW